MRALAADGQVAAALAAYDRLARGCARTSAPSPTARPRSCTSRCCASPGRSSSQDEEGHGRAEARRRCRSWAARRSSTLFRQAWADVLARGHVELMMVVGEGGIGKTRLLDAVAGAGSATGGQVLRGRCHPAERSLFLQPFVDALRPALAGLRLDALLAAVRDHEAAWVSLVPDLGQVLRGAPAPPADRDLQRRATYDAVLAGAAPAVRRRSRWCSSSTTSRTPVPPRSTCSATSPGSWPGRGSCWSAPCAARTRPWPSGWATAPGSCGCVPWMPPRSTRSPQPPGWPPTAGR